MTGSHAIDRADVMAYLDGELPTDRAAAVRAHLDGCEPCRALAQDLRRVSTRLQDWRVDTPAGAAAGLPRALDEALASAAVGRGRAWRLPGLGPGWPRWSLAAASLAAIVLVAVVARPAFWSSAVVPMDAPMASSEASDWPAPPVRGFAQTGGGRSEARTPSRSTVPGQESASKPVDPARPEPLSASSGLFELPGTVASLGEPPPPPDAMADAVATNVLAAPPLPAAPPTGAPPPPARAAEQGAAGAAAARRGLAFGAGRAEAEDTAAMRTVSLTLTVEDVTAARAAIAARAAELGGRVEPAPDALARVVPAPDPGEVSVLVPFEQVDEALEALRAIGVVSDLGALSRQDAQPDPRQLVRVTVRLRAGRE